MNRERITSADRPLWCCSGRPTMPAKPTAVGLRRGDPASGHRLVRPDPCGGRTFRPRARAAGQPADLHPLSLVTQPAGRPCLVRSHLAVNAKALWRARCLVAGAGGILPLAPGPIGASTRPATVARRPTRRVGLVGPPAARTRAGSLYRGGWRPVVESVPAVGGS